MSFVFLIVFWLVKHNNRIVEQILLRRRRSRNLIKILQIFGTYRGRRPLNLENTIGGAIIILILVILRNHVLHRDIPVSKYSLVICKGN